MIGPITSPMRMLKPINSPMDILSKITWVAPTHRMEMLAVRLMSWLTLLNTSSIFADLYPRLTFSTNASSQRARAQYSFAVDLIASMPCKDSISEDCEAALLKKSWL